MARFIAVVFLVGAAACAPAGPPQRTADIVDVITSLTEGARTILVEERQNEPNAGAKASVTIDSSTRIWAVAGRSVDRIEAGLLRVGTTVQVWFDGPVAMSYPLQGKAADVATVATSDTLRLEILSKGGASVIVRINAATAARVPCNGTAVLKPAEPGLPLLPWDVQVVRESDGRILLDQRVTQLPRWILVTRSSADLSDAPIFGPVIPCG